MPIQGRNDLEQLTGTNLPTNNSKQITAEKHREVVKALIDSKFNIKDDELKELIYEGEQTLQDKLAGLFREVIKRGHFSGLDPGGVNVGGTFNTSGIVDSATVTGTVGNDDVLVRVEFTEEAGNITEKVVIPVIHYEGTGNSWDASNDIGCPVMRIISSTKLDIAFTEFRGLTQNLKVEFIIL